MDQSNLTPKQRRFAELVASGVDQSDAYRQAYNVKASSVPSTIHRSAHDVAGNPKVAAEIERLRTGNAAAVQISVEGLVRELIAVAEEARAFNPPQLSVAVNAYAGVARVLGYVKRANPTTTTVGGQHVHLHGEGGGNLDQLRELLARVRAAPAGQQESALAAVRRDWEQGDVGT